MSLQRLLGGDPRRQSLVYLAIGGLSLAKAIAVRNDSDRFRRELREAVFFIAVGLVLRRYATMKAQRRQDVLEAVPDWILGGPSSESGTSRPLWRSWQTERTDSSPEPTYRDRARQLLSA